MQKSWDQQCIRETGEVEPSSYLFSRKSKSFAFRCIVIDKKEFMYKSEDGHITPYNSTQEKEKKKLN
jgi:hypothetical protein